MNFSNIKFQKVINDFELIKTLIINALKIKYKRSKLGFSWSMLNPAFNIILIALIFSGIMGMTYSQFAIFFFSGFLAWGLYANSVTNSSRCLLENEGLIKKIAINLIVFPIVTVGVNTIEFFLALFTLSVIFLLCGVKFSLAMLFLPISFILLVIFTTGVCLITSMLAAFYRDFSHIIVVIVQLWFYLTPVLYPKTILIGKKQIVTYLNPMVMYIDLFRDPIAYGKIPNTHEIGIACLLSIGVFSFGLFIFNKYKSKIIFNL